MVESETCVWDETDQNLLTGFYLIFSFH